MLIQLHRMRHLKEKLGQSPSLSTFNQVIGLSNNGKVAQKSESADLAVLNLESVIISRFSVSLMPTITQASVLKGTKPLLGSLTISKFGSTGEVADANSFESMVRTDTFSFNGVRFSL